MPDLKQAALAYARRDWPVFPIVPNTKRPFPNTNGVHGATTNPIKITEWWTETPNANIGFHVGAASMMAVDFDPGSDPDAFAETYDLPDETLTAITPRGGTHEFYMVPEAVPPSSSKLADKVDIRSDGSYVLLAPSVTEDGAYSWDGEDTPIAGAPLKLIEAAGESKTKAADVSTDSVEHDLPHNVEAFSTWLIKEAVTPKEGERNNVLFKTVAMARSFALSPHKAQELIWDWMISAWDAEPLSEAEFEGRIESVYSSKNVTSAQGNMTTDYHRANSVFQDESKGRLWKSNKFRIVDSKGIKAIEPPRWLIENMLPSNAYVMMFGPPGQYKSFLALDIALSIAAKKKKWLNGSAIRPNSGKVLYALGEGRPGFRQRVAAWSQERYNSLDVEGFYLADPVPLVSDGFEPFAAAIQSINREYDLIILDTVSRALAGQNENAQEIASALTLQADFLRNKFNATVLAIHHTDKTKADYRGSSVFEGDVDTLFQLDKNRLTMRKQKDAEKWEAPLPIRPHIVGDSLILKTADQVETKDAPIIERAKENNKAKKAADYGFKVALAHDRPIAEALSKMPANNGGWTTVATAEYLSATIRPGKSRQTWRGYLYHLMAADSEAGHYYYADVKRWENRKSG